MLGISYPCLCCCQQPAPGKEKICQCCQHTDLVAAVLGQATQLGFDWTIAQILGGAVDLDQLVCVGNTLRGSIEPTLGGGSAFIAQVRLYSAALGAAIAQAS